MNEFFGAKRWLGRKHQIIRNNSSLIQMIDSIHHFDLDHKEVPLWKGQGVQSICLPL